MKNIITFGFIIVSLAINAQKARSSASLSMNRSNGVTQSRQVVIDEYLNYHNHNIPHPTGKENVALSLDYNQISEQDFVVQAGIATNRILDYSDELPINVALVIDRSGSMAGDKLTYVKRALHKFVKGLRPKDYLSIVLYDSDVQVIVKSEKLKNIPNINEIINSIEDRGATNIYDGMIAGYKEVEKHFNPKATNKVILLTDGLVNTGVTDLEAIAKGSLAYNKEGIEISTIGVGDDVNFSLLQQLAKQGHGANHFIGDSEEDIFKVFEQELQSLISTLGKKVYLQFEFPKGIRVSHFIGYEPEYDGNRVRIPLENLSADMTQVVLAEVKLLEKVEKPIRVSLQYYAPREKKEKELVCQRVLKNEDIAVKDEVLKNYYIGKMAKALKAMAQEVELGNQAKANSIISNILDELNQKFPNLADNDMIRVRDILRKNLNEKQNTNLGRRRYY